MVKIPTRLEDLYPAAAIEKIMDALQQPEISGKVRETLDRVGLREMNPLDQVQQAWQQARSWIDSLSGEGHKGESTVLNATGTPFHPALSGVPLGISVAQVLASSATKVQLASVVESKLLKTVEQAFGSHRVSMSTSVYAGLQSVLNGRRVFLAKSDLLRIPEIGDLSACLANQSVVEVGASNGSSKDDWIAALQNSGETPTADRDCILVVTPNSMGPKSAELQRNVIRAAAAEFGIPIFALMADSVLRDSLSEQFGFPLLNKDTVADFDAVIAPLHLLLGGPSGAMVISQKQHANGIRRFAELSGTALRGQNLMAANLALQLSMIQDQLDSGLVAGLHANPENLQDRAKRIAIQLNDNGVVTKAIECERTSTLGPAPWDRYEFHNWAVEIHSQSDATDLATRLASGEMPNSSHATPILAAVDGEVLRLDLRFVDAKDDHLIVSALSQADGEGAEQLAQNQA